MVELSLLGRGGISSNVHGFLWIAKGIHEFVLGISLENLCNIRIKRRFSIGAP
jgi:hypothetical protein